jgi:protein SCO1
MMRVLAARITLSFLVFLVPAHDLLAKQKAAPFEQRRVTRYSCPMHPSVKSTSPGKCPKCNMALRAERQDSEKANDSIEPPPLDRVANPSLRTPPPLRIPDTAVYDQNGRRLRFYTDLVKGKTVAINFIFTTCTTICPPLTATLRRVQQELGDLAARDIALISVSVDPTTDVPERLKNFAGKFGVGPGWTFVTGNKPEIDLLLRALNAYVGDKTDHSPMMLVGNDKAGYWTRTYGLAPASDIVKIVNEAASKPTSLAYDRNRGAESARSAQSARSDDGDVQVPLPGVESKDGSTERSVDRRPAVAAASSKGGTEDLRSPSEVAASYFPNLTLVTQDNKPVRFYDDIMKNKVVVINFMFGTCTGICPPMTANLAKVQEYLGDRVGRDVNMASITVDPAIDTPDVLKRYAANYKPKTGWYFLTGKKENVDWVLYKLGGYVENKGDHNTFLIIGNEATGQWMKLFAMSKPAVIADAIMKMLSPKKD